MPWKSMQGDARLRYYFLIQTGSLSNSNNNSNNIINQTFNSNYLIIRIFLKSLNYKVYHIHLIWIKSLPSNFIRIKWGQPVISCLTLKLEIVDLHQLNCFVSNGTGSRMTTCPFTLTNCTCINCSYGLKCSLSLFRKLAFDSDSFYWRFFQGSPSPRDATDVPIHSRNCSDQFLINGKARSQNSILAFSHSVLPLSALNKWNEFHYKSKVLSIVITHTKYSLPNIYNRNLQYKTQSHTII